MQFIALNVIVKHTTLIAAIVNGVWCYSLLYDIESYTSPTVRRTCTPLLYSHCLYVPPGGSCPAPRSRVPRSRLSYKAPTKLIASSAVYTSAPFPYVWRSSASFPDPCLPLNPLLINPMVPDSCLVLSQPSDAR